MGGKGELLGGSYIASTVPYMYVHKGTYLETVCLLCSLRWREMFLTVSASSCSFAWGEGRRGGGEGGGGR